MSHMSLMRKLDCHGPAVFTVHTTTRSKISCRQLLPPLPSQTDLLARRTFLGADLPADDCLGRRSGKAIMYAHNSIADRVHRIARKQALISRTLQTPCTLHPLPPFARRPPQWLRLRTRMVPVRICPPIPTSVCRGCRTLNARPSFLLCMLCRPSASPSILNSLSTRRHNSLPRT